MRPDTSGLGVACEAQVAACAAAATAGVARLVVGLGRNGGDCCGGEHGNGRSMAVCSCPLQRSWSAEVAGLRCWALERVGGHGDRDHPRIAVLVLVVGFVWRARASSAARCPSKPSEDDERPAGSGRRIGEAVSADPAPWAGPPTAAEPRPRLARDGRRAESHDRRRALVPRALRAHARARRALHHDLRRAGRAALHRAGPARPGEHRLPGRVPLHARGIPVDVPRAALDDAPVRGLRHRRGDQRALPLPARPRADRALHGLRHAVADGPRLRPPAQRGRGRPRGRGHRHARRHGDALRRASRWARCPPR